MAEENQENVKPTSEDASVVEGTDAGETLAHAVAPNVDSQAGNASGTEAGKRGKRSQKVGIVASDKMQKTVVVRVDRLVKHTKYRRYVRRTSKFMAHDETGAVIGDKVRIVETRPLSARKRWRVVEIVQKAEK
ncbi:MAG: small subunit ribosomal protein [Acidobacteriota bacterium]|jgi:small subunit ribosomal protein S17|nr:small subunit ribosomal protein [Acidobacteriota bacterium]